MPGNEYHSYQKSSGYGMPGVLGTKDDVALAALLEAKKNGKLPAIVGVNNGIFVKNTYGTSGTSKFIGHVVVVEDIDTSKKPPIFMVRDPNNAMLSPMPQDKFYECMTWASTRK